MEDDTDEEDMDDVNIDDDRERHWRMVFEDREGGVDGKKEFLHAKRWDLYVNEKEKLVKDKYLVEVFGHDKKKVIWEVADDHVVEEPSDHEDIGLWGFDLNIFDEDEEGVVREGSGEPYIIRLIKLCPRDWISHLKRINQNVDEENRKAFNTGNVRYRKVRRFPEMNFRRTLVVSFQLLPLVLGGRGCGRRKRI